MVTILKQVEIDDTEKRSLQKARDVIQNRRSGVSLTGVGI